MDVAPLYRIIVMVEEHDPDDDDPDWDNYQHRHIVLRPAVAPDDPRYPPELIVASHRWAAGVMARATLRLTGQVEYRAEQRVPPCRPEPYGGCGTVYEDYLLDPSVVIGGEYSVQIMISVRTDEAESWLPHFRKVIGGVIAADQKPAPIRTPPATLEEQADAAHRRVQPPHNPHQQQPTTSEEQA